MPSHPVPHPDLAGYLLGILDLQETERFAAHLAGCDHCPAELADLGGLPALLAAGGAGVQLPADLQARTFARIHASDRPAALHPGGDGQLAGRRGRRAPRRGWLLAAAAAVVLLLGAVGVAALLQTRSSPEGGITLALVAPDGGRPHGVAHLHDTLAGRVIQLEVDDLPPAPAWHRYVCWFVGPADSLARPNRVAAGSFFTDSRGHAQVSWTRPVDPQQFPLVGVTLEPADGNPHRRGPKVLVTKPPS